MNQVDTNVDRTSWPNPIDGILQTCFDFVGTKGWLPGFIVFLFSLPEVVCAQANETAPAVTPPGFLEIVFSGGILGISILLVLFSLSLIAAYLIIEHLITIRRSDVIPPGLADAVRQSLNSGDLVAATQACNEHPSLLSFVLLHGMSELEFGWTSVEKALEDALAEQAARLYRKIEYLSVISNVAPMVGLLGTVSGMILAFQKVASTQGMASAPQLAEGIYQALVTTVGGLIIAIPAIGAFAVFRNRVDQFIAEAAFAAQHVFNPLRKRSKAKSESK